MMSAKETKSNSGPVLNVSDRRQTVRHVIVPSTLRLPLAHSNTSWPHLDGGTFGTDDLLQKYRRRRNEHSKVPEVFCWV